MEAKAFGGSASAPTMPQGNFNTCAIYATSVAVANILQDVYGQEIDAYINAKTWENMNLINSDGTEIAEEGTSVPMLIDRMNRTSSHWSGKDDAHIRMKLHCKEVPEAKDCKDPERIFAWSHVPVGTQLVLLASTGETQSFGHIMHVASIHRPEECNMCRHAVYARELCGVPAEAGDPDSYRHLFKCLNTWNTSQGYCLVPSAQFPVVRAVYQLTMYDVEKRIDPKSGWELCLPTARVPFVNDHKDDRIKQAKQMETLFEEAWKSDVKKAVKKGTWLQNKVLGSHFKEFFAFLDRGDKGKITRDDILAVKDEVESAATNKKLIRFPSTWMNIFDERSGRNYLDRDDLYDLVAGGCSPEKDATVYSLLEAFRIKVLTQPGLTKSDSQKSSDFEKAWKQEPLPNILKERLQDPTKKFDPQQQVECLLAGINFGRRQFRFTGSKDVIMIFGNTGVGKSTFVNYLHGCQMVQAKGTEQTAYEVSSTSPTEAIAAIGHSKESMTVFPELHESGNLWICDCPGSFDNRGSEINITNAVLTRLMLDSAQSVKLVILVTFSAIVDGRGDAFLRTVKALTELCGANDKNLFKIQGSCALGVTCAPDNLHRNMKDGTSSTHVEVDSEYLKKILKEDFTKVLSPSQLEFVKHLAESVFIYHPLDQGNSKWKKRGEILERLRTMEALYDFQDVFVAPLGVEDKMNLDKMMAELSKSALERLKRKQYYGAAQLLDRIIEVKEMGDDQIAGSLEEVQCKVQEFIDSMCSAIIKLFQKDEQDKAELQMNELYTVLKLFPKECLRSINENWRKIVSAKKEVERDRVAQKGHNALKQLDAGDVKFEIGNLVQLKGPKDNTLDGELAKVRQVDLVRCQCEVVLLSDSRSTHCIPFQKLVNLTQLAGTCARAPSADGSGSFKRKYAGQPANRTAEHAQKRERAEKRVEEWKKADVKYHDHPDGVKELIDQISQDCKDSKTNFGHDAFEKLHRAVRGCKDELGEECSNGIGGLHPASPEQAFKHAKLDTEDHDQLSAVEICKWLDDIRRGFGSAAAKRFATKFGQEYGPFGSFLRRVLLRIRADREANNFIQAYELQRLRHEYATSYRKLKENSVGVTVPNERLDEVLVQDVMLGKDYEALKPAAQKTKLKLDALLKEIHKNLDGIAWVKEAALKSDTRALQKIAEDYGRFHLRLIDIVRASVVCRDLQTINQVIKYLKENLCGELEVLRVKSDFDLMSRLSDCVGGYPDCKVNCRFRDEELSLIFELQLHVEDMKPSDEGWKLYNWSTQFYVKTIVTGVDVVSDLSADLLDEISSVLITTIQQKEKRNESKQEIKKWQLALTHLSMLTKERRDRQYVKSLKDQAEKQHEEILSKCGANESTQQRLDYAEIMLLACISGEYENETEAIELGEKARREVHKLKSEIEEKNGEVDEGVMLLLARCEQALGLEKLRQYIPTPNSSDQASETGEGLKIALDYFRRAEKIFTKFLSLAHPVALSLHQSIGDTFMAMTKTELGRTVDALGIAESIFERTLATITASAVMGEQPIQAAFVHHSLGKILMEMNDFDRAAQHFGKAVEIQEKNRGKHHKAVATERYFFAKCRHKADGPTDEALCNLKKAVAIYAAVEQGHAAQKRDAELDQSEQQHLEDSRILIEQMQQALEVEHTVRSGVAVSTLNFLGNNYNPFEFYTSEPGFTDAYESVFRKVFKKLESSVVLEEAKKISQGIIDEQKLESYVLDKEKLFLPNLTRKFLRQDNKFNVELRVNLIVGAMMPSDTGRAAYHEVHNWREAMKQKIEHYKKDPELVLWDTACNLTCENNICKYDYKNICDESFLNPASMKDNLRTMLKSLEGDGDRKIVCACQEFPEQGSTKLFALGEELIQRGLMYKKPPKDDCSVAFILSADLVVESFEHAPCGQDAQKIVDMLVKKGALRDGEISDKETMSCLATTARKTLVMDIRPGLRFVNVHAKEFKTEEGLELLAKYVWLLADNPKGYATVVLIDANTGKRNFPAKFEDCVTQQGFQVLSPTSKDYITTRKKRTELHGQIYSTDKCNKQVETHKAFVAVLEASKPDNLQYRGIGLAVAKPNLAEDRGMLLPCKAWPTDCCMLQVELTTEEVDQELEAAKERAVGALDAALAAEEDQVEEINEELEAAKERAVQALDVALELEVAADLAAATPSDQALAAAVASPGQGTLEGTVEQGIAGSGANAAKRLLFDADAYEAAARPVEAASAIESKLWRVAYKEVNVRRAPNLLADPIGIKEDGRIVIGKDRGEWVELVYEPGFILRKAPTDTGTIELLVPYGAQG